MIGQIQAEVPHKEEGTMTFLLKKYTLLIIIFIFCGMTSTLLKTLIMKIIFFHTEIIQKHLFLNR